MSVSETCVREEREDGRKTFRYMYSITADSDREERPVNRYGSQAIARATYKQR